jgi:hypothetical protein
VQYIKSLASREIDERNGCRHRSERRPKRPLLGVNCPMKDLNEDKFGIERQLCRPGGLICHQKPIYPISLVINPDGGGLGISLDTHTEDVRPIVVDIRKTTCFCAVDFKHSFVNDALGRLWT